jgi:hypothetical protein
MDQVWIRFLDILGLSAGVMVFAYFFLSGRMNPERLPLFDLPRWAWMIGAGLAGALTFITMTEMSSD